MESIQQMALRLVENMGDFSSFEGVMHGISMEEGWGWVFVNVEHWTAEVMGWQVCKKGNRFAGLEPVSQGILSQFGSVEAGIARGLELMLRMDTGPQYRSEDFQNQVKTWGRRPASRSSENPRQTPVLQMHLFQTLKELP